jgi:predicted Zn-dependent peptidase
VLVVAGHVTEADLRAKLAPLLAGWKPRPVPPARLAKPAAHGATTIYLVDKPGAPQSSIRIGTVGVPRATPDYHELLVMNEILGGGFRRLDLELREKRGWTYGARSNFDMRRAAGPWSAGGEFVANKTADSVGVLLHQIEAIRDVDVSDEELAEAKQSIIRAFPARFETMTQIAGQLAALAIYDLPADHLRNFTKRIAKVTKADVRRVARKALDPKHLAVVVVGDQKSNEPDLRKLGPVVLRDLDGRPATNATAAAPAAP